ncbi:MAG: hypothetical protein QM765_35895 [Myxococcales bacterium]
MNVDQQYFIPLRSMVVPEMSNREVVNLRPKGTAGVEVIGLKNGRTRLRFKFLKGPPAEYEVIVEDTVRGRLEPMVSWHKKLRLVRQPGESERYAIEGEVDSWSSLEQLHKFLHDDPALVRLSVGLAPPALQNLRDEVEEELRARKLNAPVRVVGGHLVVGPGEPPQAERVKAVLDAEFPFLGALP